MTFNFYLTGVAPADGTGEKDLVSYLTAFRFTLHTPVCDIEFWDYQTVSGVREFI